MSRDYKPRAQGRSAGQRRQKSDGQPRVGLWRWMLITAIIISFAVFLVYLRSTGSKQINPQPSSQATSNKADAENAAATSKEEKKPEVKLPHFDFYTLLPEEAVVPEHEIKRRTREERVGKAKGTHYFMQAGSFKTFKEADQLRAKLAAMGIESKVRKTKVNSVNLYRVKMGPFTQTASFTTIQARLKQNGIAVITTETGD